MPITAISIVPAAGAGASSAAPAGEVIGKAVNKGHSDADVDLFLAVERRSSELPVVAVYVMTEAAVAGDVPRGSGAVRGGVVFASLGCSSHARAVLCAVQRLMALSR